MYRHIEVVVFALWFTIIFGDQCNLKDQECITLAMKRLYPVLVAGDASLGVASSDPLFNNKIEAVSSTLNYTSTNVQMEGLSNCDVREARFNLADEHSVWHLFLDCPILRYQLHYQMDGYVASEWIQGEGEAEIELYMYEISLNGDLRKEIREENNIYIQLNNYVVTRLEVKDKAIFNFHNLFPGDEERTKNVNNFINNRWQEFNSQAQTPAMRSQMGLLIDHFNQYFNKVSINEIFTN